MALVAGGFTLLITVVDSAGDKTTRSYQLTAATAADAATEGAALVALFDPLTEGVISRYAISQQFIEDAFAYPAGGVEVENTAQILGRIDGDPTKTASFNIPAAAGGIFVATTGPNRNVVDMADAAVVAFLAEFATGGTALISDGEALDPTTPGVSGKRLHKKNNKG